MVLQDPVPGGKGASVSSNKHAKCVLLLSLQRLTYFPCVLCTGNARHLRALLAAATKLSAFLQQPQGSSAGAAPAAATAAGRAMTVNDFQFAAGLDHVNMFSLVRCPPKCLPHRSPHSIGDTAHSACFTKGSSTG